MEISEENKQIISSFLNEFIRLSGAKTCLFLDNFDGTQQDLSPIGLNSRPIPNLDNLNLFYDLINIEKDTFSFKMGPKPNLKFWDVILGVLPFKNLTSNREMTCTIEAFSNLSPNGYGILGIRSYFLSKTDVRGLLESNGYSIAAIFNPPKKIFGDTRIEILFLILKKCTVRKEFIGKLDSSEQVVSLLGNFFSNNEGHNFINGTWLESGVFRSFSKWKIQQQISSLETEYHDFRKIKLGDVVTIRSGNPRVPFENIENCIYLSRHALKPVVSDLSKLSRSRVHDEDNLSNFNLGVIDSEERINHQFYYQMICNPEKVDAEYLVAFFDSTLGHLILESLRSDEGFFNITRHQLAETEIALPSIKTQNEIVSSTKKLNLIKQKISSFETNLALNPISSEYVLNQIDLMLEVVGELAESDKVKSIIRSGESKSVEFKETLSLNIRNQTKDKIMEDVVIKTIAAFFNTNGGTLLIGIDDSGVIKGIDKELEKFYENKDKFLLHFKNLFKTRIGEEFYPYMENSLIVIDFKVVLYVSCQQSSSAVYVDGKDFYVRTNPATDKLEGPKLVAYINNHFKH
jgi:hypothetical protein